MDPNTLIGELEKIHEVQPTIPASILLAIRARMEFKAGYDNRIGKTFPHGNKGVLLVGKAGSGKTKCLSTIFNGLDLEKVNKQGHQVGKWLHSTGGSTGIGIYEVLESYYDSIIFADELSLDTEKHVHVIKQIANGELVRPRHGEIDPTPFTGLLIGATNAIKLPSSTMHLEHLLAALDRFMVVRVNAINKSPESVMDEVLKDKKTKEINWELIARALTQKNKQNLNKNEETLIRSLWKQKSKEILDNTRPQWRNTHTIIDIFLFCKRFFNLDDVTKNDIIIRFIEDMIRDCILFNPVSILHLSPLEQIIYDTISTRDMAATSEILQSVHNSGMSVSRMTINRTMNKMQENNLIVKRSHGKYSTKNDDNAYTKVGTLPQDESSQAISELSNLL